MKYYWITALVFMGLLGICAFLEYLQRKNREKKKWLSQQSTFPFYQISNYPVLMIFICSLVICAAIFLVEAKIEGIAVDDSSSILMCLTVIGFIGTVIGLVLTYMQLKRNNNQFYGYYDFYRVAEEILSLKSKRKIKFYFSTPIPGHIAYGNDKEFKLFLKKLVDYDGDIEFIVPDANQLKQFYEPYKNKTIRNIQYTEELIKELFTCQPGKKNADPLDVATFVNSLRAKDKARVYTYSASQGREPESIENLYMSDGRIAVYAIPLHYLNLQDESGSENGGNDPRPVLVGFTTTDRSLVSSLEDYFERLKKNDGCKELQKGEQYL